MRRVGYGRTTAEPQQNIGRRKYILLGIFGSLFVVAAVLVTVAVAVSIKNSRAHSDGGTVDGRSVGKVINLACKKTLYPNLCVSTLMSYPGLQSIKPGDLAHISANMSIHSAQHAFQIALSGSERAQGKAKVPYHDCLELIADTLSQLNESIESITGLQAIESDSIDDKIGDVKTWLSAAITNLDTCMDGFDSESRESNPDLSRQAQKLTQMVSNTLALFGTMFPDDGSIGAGIPGLGSPIGNKKRKLLSENSVFPEWIAAHERHLLQAPAAGIQADAVVAADGTARYRTIADAVKDAPSNSQQRYVIYVKAGLYRENVTISRKKTNIMFIGDGKGRTIVTAGRSVLDGFTTYRSATFAASGNGFLARDMTFINTAGPARHQAVAFRLGADKSAVFRCSFVGYQDTLYVHSQRQFFRECDVYGTVDFIFGNAAVVLQKCSMYPRKPMPNQKNTITAQNRKDPNQNTGISIHDCRITPASDLAPVKAAYPTYLGRPWKLYARTVYLQTYMDDLINPAGWLEWNGNLGLDTLYYGEYMNSGPGAALARRVRWPGYHIITTVEEASIFTVGRFISGTIWLPSTGFAYIAGLSS